MTEIDGKVKEEPSGMSSEGLKERDIQSPEEEEKENACNKDNADLVPSKLFENVQFSKGTKNRVKLYYHATGMSQWDDVGTGHAVCLDNGEGTKEHWIHFRKDGENVTCFDWKIQNEVTFMRQQGTLVIFAPNDDYQGALSFQLIDGADAFWAQLCGILGRDPADEGDVDTITSSDDEHSSSSPDSIPSIKLNTLCELEKLTIIAQRSQVMKDRVAVELVKNKWLHELLDVYNITHDLNETFSLNLIGRIIKNLLMMNNDDIVKHLFEPNNLKSVLEMLSHVHGEDQAMDNVEFLYEKAHYKKVINIRHEDIVERIHRAYRIQYLLDYILPPRLSAAIAPEESWTGAIDGYLAALRNSILCGLLKDPSFESELICGLESPDTSVIRRRELTLFLKEFIGMTDTRFMTPLSKKNILEPLLAFDVLRLIKPNLMSNDYSTCKSTVEIFRDLATYDAKEVLRYVIDDGVGTDANDAFVMTELMRLIVEDTEPELQMSSMIVQAIRGLMVGGDDQPTPNLMERHHFVGLFFKKSLRTIIQPLLNNIQDKKLLNETYQFTRKASIIISLISFCIEHHPVAIRPHLISSGFFNAVACSVNSKYPSLILCSIRAVKTALLLNHESYNQHLLDEGVVVKLVSVFCKKYKHGNNMYNSSFLSFFQSMVAHEKILENIMKNFESELKDLTYCSTFDQLWKKYKSNTVYSLESPESPTPAKAEFSDADEAPAEAPKTEIPDSDFKPRAPTVREVDESLKTCGARPPTPIRINIKIPLRQPETFKDGDKENNASNKPSSMLEPLRLVDYEDSDRDSSGKEDDDELDGPSDDQPEQRGKKRKAFGGAGEEEDAVLKNGPKRSSFEPVVDVVNGI